MGLVDFRFLIHRSRGQVMGNSLALRTLCSKRYQMAQRVGYFIVFLALLFGGTVFLMWIAP